MPEFNNLNEKEIAEIYQGYDRVIDYVKNHLQRDVEGEKLITEGYIGLFFKPNNNELNFHYDFYFSKIPMKYEDKILQVYMLHLIDIDPKNDIFQPVISLKISDAFNEVLKYLH